MVAHTLILALGRRKHEMIWLGRVRKWYGGAETGARPPFDWGVGEVRNGCGLLLCFSDLSALIPWFLTLGLYWWDQLEFVLHCIGYVFLIAVTKTSKKKKEGRVGLRPGIELWLHGLSIQNIMLEEAWQWKRKVRVHLVSAVRKHRLINASDTHCKPLPLSCISVEIPLQVLSRQWHLRLKQSVNCEALYNTK